MFLKNLVLFNFKSYEDHKFEFDKGLNFIVGKNGSGKTNILESIYFSCLTKSFSGLKDTQLIKHEAQMFVVNLKIDKIELVASVKEGHRKQFLLNKKIYEKITDHIGKFPVIFVSPNDHDYIRDSSDRRRSLFDELFCQVSSEYLFHLIEYTRVLKQRNQLLKQFKERNYQDIDLLKTYDAFLAPHHVFIANYRNENIEWFAKICGEYYAKISTDAEQIELCYLHDNTLTLAHYNELALSNRTKDLNAQRTHTGCHKDDFDFLIHNLPLKKYGSQGQQKSFMLSLQLAKYDFLQLKTGKSAFLLLDDVFDKLDSSRIQKLLEIVSDDRFGQVFITDASTERTKDFLQNLTTYKIIEL